MFENCWDENSDGGGFAYVEDTGIKVVKEMNCVGDFYHKYRKVREVNLLPMLIHFRFATSGLVNEANCHPFKVSSDLVMAHNGILDNVIPTQTDSDTSIFNRSILALLPRDFIYNEGIKQLLSNFIDDSKLIFLDKYGMYSIINEHLGHWDIHHLNWYSNYGNLNYQELKYKSAGKSARHGYHGNLIYCESCGNYAEMEHFDFLTELNDLVCNDCIKWYKSQTRHF
jgi:hypothetical protein